MPEIWLRYGTTDVALDIRFENLYKEITPRVVPLQEDQIDSMLRGIPLKDNCLLIVFSSTPATKQVLSSLVNSAINKGVTGNIMIPLKLKEFINVGNEKWSSSLLSGEDLLALRGTMAKFDQTLFLSHSSYDPLFGFEGTPTHLLRKFMKDKMAEAIALRGTDMPSPGTMLEPYRLALSLCSEIDALSVEIVGDSNRISDVYWGSLDESFKNASSKLAENTNLERQQVKSEIISPGSELFYHSTLADSLNSLWNCISVLNRNGSAILLSESKRGLGSEALQTYIEGRSHNSSSTGNSKYVDGQEHLIFLEAVRERYNLGIVSTIPEYYLRTKLGFETFDSLKQVLGNLLSRHGKNHKVTLVSDAHFTLPLVEKDLNDGDLKHPT